MSDPIGRGTGLFWEIRRVIQPSSRTLAPPDAGAPHVKIRPVTRQSSITRIVRVAAVLFAALAPFAGSAWTAPLSLPTSTAPTPQDPSVRALEELLDLFDRTPGVTVAEVSGTSLTRGMVADRIRALPPIARAQPPRAVYQAALADLVQQRALAIKGRQLGLDQNPLIQGRLAMAGDHELAGAALRSMVPDQVSDAALQERYAAEYAGKPGPEEVRLRLIAAASQADAEEAIGKLKGGMEFAAAVRAFSRDPSKINDGSVGFVSADRLPPELRNVAFALAAGQMTSYPIQYDGLWYILLVEGRRQGPTPSLQQVTLLLRQELLRDAAAAAMRQARAEVQVKDYGPTGAKPADQGPAQ